MRNIEIVVRCAGIKKGNARRGSRLLHCLLGVGIVGDKVGEVAVSIGHAVL